MKPAGPQRVASTEGFSTPESVLYDAEQQVWFVSNINGGPSAKDDNGFISRLTVAGAIDSLHFIQGGRDGVDAQRAQGPRDHGRHALGDGHRHGARLQPTTGAPVVTIEIPGSAPSS